MSLLRIALGFKTESFREEVPAVLYIGYDGDAARKAAADAGPEFHRIELVESRGGHRLRKQAPVVPSNTTSIAPVLPSPAEPEPAVDPEPVAEAPAGEDETSPASGEESDAPSLLPETNRRRR